MKFSSFKVLSKLNGATEIKANISILNMILTMY